MKSYKQDVLDAAIEGLISGGLPEERAKLVLFLLDRVYESGYNEAMRNAEAQESYRYYNSRNQLWTVGPEYLVPSDSPKKRTVSKEMIKDEPTRVTDRMVEAALRQQYGGNRWHDDFWRQMRGTIEAALREQRCRPLTEEEIWRLDEPVADVPWKRVVTFVRWIERAHGIGGDGDEG